MYPIVFILSKNQELLQVNYELQEELEIVDLERQTFEEQNITHSDELKDNKNQMRCL